MASKWSGLKEKLPAFEQEPAWQAKVEEKKKEYIGLDTAELAREFRNARQTKKQYEDCIAVCNMDLEALSQLLINDLESSQMQKVQLATGETVYIQIEPYCSVQDKSAVMEWIKKKKLTAMLSVQWQTLNAFVKEQLVTGKPSPPGVAVFLKTSARLRGGNSNTGEE
jgi:hypothetical protein